jgi:hypothetical protein
MFWSITVFGVFGAVGLDRRVAPAEYTAEVFGRLVKYRQRVFGRKVGLVAEVRVRASSEDRNRLAYWRACTETRVFRVEGRKEAQGVGLVRHLHRLPRKGKVEAVEVYYHRQPHALVLCHPVGEEHSVEHLLACRAVELQETRVPGGEYVVVVGLKRYGRREGA